MRWLAPGDGDQVAAVYRDAVLSQARGLYSEAQIRAWAQVAQEPAFRAVVAVRVSRLTRDVPDGTALAEAWRLSQGVAVHPIEQVVHAQLGELAARRQHVRNDEASLFDPGAWGAPSYWRVVGPFSPLQHVDLMRRFSPETDAVLDDDYRTAGGEIERRLVPTGRTPVPNCRPVGSTVCCVSCEPAWRRFW
jgi:hypothetical protein